MATRTVVDVSELGVAFSQMATDFLNSLSYMDTEGRGPSVMALLCKAYVRQYNNRAN